MVSKNSALIIRFSKLILTRYFTRVCDHRELAQSSGCPMAIKIDPQSFRIVLRHEGPCFRLRGGVTENAVVSRLAKRQNQEEDALVLHRLHFVGHHLRLGVNVIRHQDHDIPSAGTLMHWNNDERSIPSITVKPLDKIRPGSRPTVEFIDR